MAPPIKRNHPLRDDCPSAKSPVIYHTHTALASRPAGYSVGRKDKLIQYTNDWHGGRLAHKFVAGRGPLPRAR